MMRSGVGSPERVRCKSGATPSTTTPPRAILREMSTARADFADGL
jgi:hypothetical protein